MYYVDFPTNESYQVHIKYLFLDFRVEDSMGWDCSYSCNWLGLPWQWDARPQLSLHFSISKCETPGCFETRYHVDHHLQACMTPPLDMLSRPQPVRCSKNWTCFDGTSGHQCDCGRKLQLKKNAP